MKFLAGKTAIVTGAAQGAGRATALALVRAGAQVIVHYGHGAREAEKLVDEIRYLGGRALGVEADLSSADGPRKLACRVHSIVGDRLDILVTNAEIAKAPAVEETTVEDFDALFAAHIRAPYFLVQQLLPILCEGSSVTLLSPPAVHMAVGAICACAATQGAVGTLVKHMAGALGQRGIRVNAVVPDVARPEGTAAAVAFLACGQARWTTGAIVHADGGSRF